MKQETIDFANDKVTVFFILNVAVVGYCQGVGLVLRAALIVSLRGFALLISAFMLLPAWWPGQGIWLAMPSSEMLTTFFAFACFLHRSRALGTRCVGCL